MHVSPAALWVPDYLPISAWVTHGPFAFWLTDSIRPRRFVELGTHHGFSFFAFCQAIKRLDLDATAFAIDTWAGDEHAGRYDDSVFQAVSLANAKYSGFSSLLRCTFDDALSYFDDRSIDLLHIDGQHHYEDVKRDFESWSSKLTDDAVVLFHDTNVREREFGVWRFFQELSERHPAFEFHHGHGLGLLCPGSRIPEGLLPLMQADAGTRNATRLAYAALGAAVEVRQKTKLLRDGLAALQKSSTDLSQSGLAALAIASGDDIAVVHLGSMIADARRMSAEAAAVTQAAVERTSARDLEHGADLEAERASRLEAERAARSAAEALADARLHEQEGARAYVALEDRLAQAAAENAGLGAKVQADTITIELLRACLGGRIEANKRLRMRVEGSWDHDTQPFRRLLASERDQISDVTGQLDAARHRLAQWKLWGEASGNRTPSRAETPVGGSQGRDRAETTRNTRARRLLKRIQSRVLARSERADAPTMAEPVVDPVDSDVVALDESGLFDRSYYLEQNPDVAAAAIDPARHFAQTGWKEGRKPNPFFDPGFYIADRPDVAESGMNPLLHYMQYGRFEDQPTASAEQIAADTLAAGDSLEATVSKIRNSGLFDEEFYRHHSPDLAEPAVDAAQHYLESGWRENRNPSAFFDTRYYLDAYPDVATLGINPLLHFIETGAEEGRRPAPPPRIGVLAKHLGLSEEDLRLVLEVQDTGLFDADFYYSYPEVAASGVEPTLHFVRQGWREGRQPSALFDIPSYLRLNADVAESGSNPLVHFARHGALEGRPVFAPTDYVEGKGMSPIARDLIDLHRKRLFTGDAKAKLDSFFARDQRISFPRVEQADISILVILWNQAHLTLRCLQALREQEGPSLEIVIVDNASTDRTADLLARVDGIKVASNRENEGFLLACNRGASLATGRTLLLLNNDAFVRKGALAAALSTLDASPDIGAVGGRLIMPSGRLQEAGSIIWADASTLGYGRNGDADAGEAMFRRDVDYCSGAFLLTPRAVWNRLGGFDEAYVPAYYEEADYCMRLREHGLRVVYEPSATIDHFEFGSETKKSNTLKMSRRNQKKFRQRHALTLSRRHLPPAVGNIIGARTRPEQGQRRILIIDNEVPYGWLGSGYPRARAMIQAIAATGWFATFFPMHKTKVDWSTARQELTEEVEIASGWGAPRLVEFMEERRSYYQTIIVSRPDNMRSLNAIMVQRPDLFSDTRIIYDAEALFSAREILQARWNGTPLRQADADTKVSAETGLAETADAVICVSPLESAIFEEKTKADVFVLNHPTICEQDTRSFSERSGFLFVGRLLEHGTPNWEGLAWFIRDCWPGIRARMPTATLRVAGPLNVIHAALEGPGIELLGRVDDLRQAYATSRVFVAPVHFAAGIPIKILEATAAGLPTVGTSLMAKQLSWSPQQDMFVSDDADLFIDRCVELHTNENAWRGVIAAGRERIRREYSPERFNATLAALLDPRGETGRAGTP